MPARLALRAALLAAFSSLFFLVLACSSGSPDTAGDDAADSDGAGGPSATATQPAAPEDRIRLVTTSATEHYLVYGSTSQEIAAYIDNYGPTDSSGTHASGVTAAVTDFTWRADSRPGICGIASVDLTLNILVKLPRHAQPERLTPDLRRTWDEFAAAVAWHENRHVEIATADMELVRDEMAAIQPKREGCSAVEAEIVGIWDAAKVRTTANQDAFHTQEDARIEKQLSELRAQFSANDGRIAFLAEELRSLDNRLGILERDVNALDAELNAMAAELERMRRQYGEALPPEVYVRYETTRALYNAGVPRYNQFLDEYRATRTRRDALASEHNALIAARNRLVDKYNLAP
jgi:predicted secreted Zn-dependent protease